MNPLVAFFPYFSLIFQSRSFYHFLLVTSSWLERTIFERNNRDEGVQFGPSLESVDGQAFCEIENKRTRRNNKNNVIEAFERFIRTVHPFFLLTIFERVLFLLIQGSTGLWPTFLITTKRGYFVFCQQRGSFLVYGPAGPFLPPRIRLRPSVSRNFPISLISLSLLFPPPSTIFLYEINKYRFCRPTRLCTILLTRIEFRTDDREGTGVSARWSSAEGPAEPKVRRYNLPKRGLGPNSIDTIKPVHSHFRRIAVDCLSPLVLIIHGLGISLIRDDGDATKTGAENQ